MASSKLTTQSTNQESADDLPPALLVAKATEVCKKMVRTEKKRNSSGIFHPKSNGGQIKKSYKWRDYEKGSKRQ